MDDQLADLKEKEKKAGWEAGEWGREDLSVCGPASKDSDPLMWGVFLILIGLAFFFSRFTGLVFRNWWAWFILIPAGMKLFRALRMVDTRGRMTSGAASLFSGGLFLLLIGSMFLFGLSWSLFWPLLLICLGLNGVLWAFAR